MASRIDDEGGRRIGAFLHEASQTSDLMVRNFIQSVVERLREEPELSELEDMLLLVRSLEVMQMHCSRARMDMLQRIFEG